ncbi:MAG: AraC family transcriptional regulator [Ignavibacteria bacterium]
MNKLYIKNMVCGRCIKVVSEELNKLGIRYSSIQLGEVELSSSIANDKLEKLRSALLENGFELIDDSKTKLIESVKTLIIKSIYQNNKPEEINYSDYLSKATGKPYTVLSSLFSSVENTTIEKYIISQKIERTKELLVYGELTLSEIAYRLGYSSSQHLSNQFKKVTGFTPSYFKELKAQKRRFIDKIIKTDP